jgi:hypothetical protein
VAQAMKRQPLLAVAGAPVALAFLVVMAIVGALPQQRQLVRFEANGVMKIAPEEITRVEIVRQGQSRRLVRRASQWSIEHGAELAPDLARHASMAVQFMNTSGPLRVMDAPELTGSDPRDFGLDPPKVQCVLYRGEQRVLGARFGAHNPDDTAQYMVLDGGPELYLMSRFVGQEWEDLATGLKLGRVSAAPSAR